MLWMGRVRRFSEITTGEILQRTTALWAAQMDKITEKAGWRAVRGPALCNWCKSDPTHSVKTVYCGLSQSFFTASYVGILKIKT
ncbi:MAG: hypothetical protein D3910_14005 [Candidatus Electrothrix sp. ATG2]|nr:hypothetical protein [Candidatus Electrothrix sp. ATG2]